MPNFRLAHDLICFVTACAAQCADVPIRAPAPSTLTPVLACTNPPAMLSQAPAQPAPAVRTICAAPVPLKRLRGKLDRAVVKTAQEQLNFPMGSGRYVSVQSKLYLFCLEPHYHEPGSGQGPNGWHKGVTVYEAT